MKLILRAALIIGLIPTAATIAMDQSLAPSAAYSPQQAAEDDPWKRELGKVYSAAIAAIIKEYMVLPRNTEEPIECIFVNNRSLPKPAFIDQHYIFQQ